MAAMIEIWFSGGRVRRIPESEFVAEGECAAAVVDIDFGDLSEGLVIRFRHHEPVRPDPQAIGIDRDPRGLPTAMYNDSFAVLATPQDLTAVKRVLYEGAIVLARLEPGGDLVNLHGANQARTLYLGDAASRNPRLMLAELYAAVTRELREHGEQLPESAACEILCIDGNTVASCLAFQASYAATDPAYAKRNGLDAAGDAIGELDEQGEHDKWEEPDKGFLEGMYDFS